MSTPHRSETKGIAERAVRRVKEGTSAVLLHSGLNESWWADSMEYHCFLRIVHDLLTDGRTPYERFEESLKGSTISIGLMMNISQTPKKSMREFISSARTYYQDFF